MAVFEEDGSVTMTLDERRIAALEAENAALEAELATTRANARMLFEKGEILIAENERLRSMAGVAHDILAEEVGTLQQENQRLKNRNIVLTSLTGKLTIDMVEAYNKQQQRIAALEAENAALKAEVAFRLDRAQEANDLKRNLERAEKALKKISNMTFEMGKWHAWKIAYRYFEERDANRTA